MARRANFWGRTTAKDPALLTELTQLNKLRPPKDTLSERADGTMDNNGTYTEDEWEFMEAVDKYKRLNHRPHPTWSEVLAVLISLGWRKVAEATEFPGK